MTGLTRSTGCEHHQYPDHPVKLIPATDAEAVNLWTHYLDRWTKWNHVRTFVAMVAALLCALGLLQKVGG